jgi:hypothetical protein
MSLSQLCRRQRNFKKLKVYFQPSLFYLKRGYINLPTFSYLAEAGAERTVVMASTVWNNIQANSPAAPSKGGLLKNMLNNFSSRISMISHSTYVQV